MSASPNDRRLVELQISCRSLTKVQHSLFTYHAAYRDIAPGRVHPSGGESAPRAGAGSAEGVRVQMRCYKSQTVSFGFVDNRPGGWQGEDRLGGVGANGNSEADICHEKVPGGELFLRTVATAAEVVPLQTTRITDTIANGGHLEWIWADARRCFTGGGDGSYYAEMGCYRVEAPG